LDIKPEMAVLERILDECYLENILSGISELMHMNLNVCHGIIKV
jgi:hypothetical protein